MSLGNRSIAFDPGTTPEDVLRRAAASLREEAAGFQLLADQNRGRAETLLGQAVVYDQAVNRLRRAAREEARAREPSPPETRIEP